ncbi:MAG: ABC transporter ATP-binding protein [Acidobacteriota bacterium]
MPDSSPAPTARIDVQDLTKRLRSGDRLLTILDSITLQIPAGQFVAILGPSGSGKSTLLSLMAGLDRPTEGSIQLDGRALEKLSEDELAELRLEKVGFVFQSFQLLTHQTAKENVLLPLELAGSHADPSTRADELLEMVGLGERGHHYPVQLSGGEQQRVALARAFATEPPILFADEPTGNLDGTTGQQVLELLERLHQESKTTLVMVTHDPGVAARADRQIYLRDGRVERDVMGGDQGGDDELDGAPAGPLAALAEAS